jgi:hypothetical protein
VAGGQVGSLLHCPRQQLEEALQHIGTETEARRKLPQDRPQLRPEHQQAGSEEVRQRNLHVAQLQHVRNEA